MSRKCRLKKTRTELNKDHIRIIHEIHFRAVLNRLPFVNYEF